METSPYEQRIESPRHQVPVFLEDRSGPYFRKEPDGTTDTRHAIGGVWSPVVEPVELAVHGTQSCIVKQAELGHGSVLPNDYSV